MSRTSSAPGEAPAQTNARTRALAAARHDLFYIDVAPAMLENGAPKDIYRADRLHITPAGYAIWAGIVRPVPLDGAKRPTTCRAG